MPDGVPPFAKYVPGASSRDNSNRRQPVRAVTVHRTQGNDSRGLGKNRVHSSPGTFNFLLRDDALYCYYPAWVRCSHAAGANRAGPGIEIEGFTGNPLSAAQLKQLGELARWLHDTYGVPLNLHDGARIAVDGSGFKGFVNHNSVETEPQYRHVDRISVEEFNRAVGATPDNPPEGNELMYCTIDGETFYYFHAGRPSGKRMRKATQAERFVNAKAEVNAVRIAYQTFAWLNDDNYKD